METKNLVKTRQINGVEVRYISNELGEGVEMNSEVVKSIEEKICDGKTSGYEKQTVENGVAFFTWDIEEIVEVKKSLPQLTDFVKKIEENGVYLTQVPADSNLTDDQNKSFTKDGQKYYWKDLLQDFMNSTNQVDKKGKKKDIDVSFIEYLDNQILDNWQRESLDYAIDEIVKKMVKDGFSQADLYKFLDEKDGRGEVEELLYNLDEGDDIEEKLLQYSEELKVYHELPNLSLTFNDVIERDEDGGHLSHFSYFLNGEVNNPLFDVFRTFNINPSEFIKELEKAVRATDNDYIKQMFSYVDKEENITSSLFDNAIYSNFPDWSKGIGASHETLKSGVDVKDFVTLFLEFIANHNGTGEDSFDMTFVITKTQGWKEIVDMMKKDENFDFSLIFPAQTLGEVQTSRYKIKVNNGVVVDIDKSFLALKSDIDNYVTPMIPLYKEFNVGLDKIVIDNSNEDFSIDNLYFCLIERYKKHYSTKEEYYPIIWDRHLRDKCIEEEMKLYSEWKKNN